MNQKDIMNAIDNQLVDDYKEMKIYMNRINNILKDVGLDSRYETYDQFCIDIKKSVRDLMDRTDEIDPMVLIKESLNNMIINKIAEDDNYEEKLAKFLENYS